MRSSWFKLTLPLLILLGIVTFVVQRRQLEAGENTPNPSYPDQAATGKQVIIISIDGLRSDAITSLCPSRLPNFQRLRDQGASTYNARSVFHYTETVPNHISMATGRSVEGPSGHQFSNNGNPGADQTLHQTNNTYIASIFDVAHDYGLRTGFFSSKDKLRIIEQSYQSTTGAPDTIGVNHGNDKIDVYTVTGTNGDSTPTIDTLITNLNSDPPHLSFVHLADLDVAGHAHGWMSPEYLAALEKVDENIGRVLEAVDSNNTLDGHATVIVTADHGGDLTSHALASRAVNYTIPFFVWGRDVTPGADLYAMNAASRTNPGPGRPSYDDPKVPIRNADSANLALLLLDLPPVPCSDINFEQDLVTNNPNIPVTFRLNICRLPDLSRSLTWTPIPGSLYTVEKTNNPFTGPWTPLGSANQWPTPLTSKVDTEAVTPGVPVFYRVKRTTP